MEWNNDDVAQEIFNINYKEPVLIDIELISGLAVFYKYNIFLEHIVFFHQPEEYIIFGKRKTNVGTMDYETYIYIFSTSIQSTKIKDNLSLNWIIILR